MKKVQQVIRCVKVAGEYGIEIECEGYRLPNIELNDYWAPEKDGSLRGRYPDQAAEYVLKAPVKFNEVDKVLNNLKDNFKNSKLNFTFRTSVHVHLNCQQFDENQLFNLIYTYMLLEEPMMNYCGDERKNNRFCLRVQDADQTIDIITNIIRNGINELKDLQGEWIRYSALNLAALPKYGSIEFRGMRGNMDVPILNNWVGAIEKLKQYALSRETVVDIVEDFNNLGAIGFARQVFGELFETFNYPKLEREMYQSFSLCLDVPYLYKYYAVPRLALDKGKPEKVEEEIKIANPKFRINNPLVGNNFEIPPDAFQAAAQIFEGRVNPIRGKLIRPAPVILNDIQPAEEFPVIAEDEPAQW